jgi:hypothetical protein
VASRGAKSYAEQTPILTPRTISDAYITGQEDGSEKSILVAKSWPLPVLKEAVTASASIRPRGGLLIPYAESAEFILPLARLDADIVRLWGANIVTT